MGGEHSDGEISLGKDKSRKAWPLPRRVVSDDGSSHFLFLLTCPFELMACPSLGFLSLASFQPLPFPHIPNPVSAHSYCLPSPLVTVSILLVSR